MTKKNNGLLIKESPYHIINICFAGIIILIFLYSGIFSAEKNNYPIKSACEVLTGEPCSSSGLSRAFSEIVRFNFDSAIKYNDHSIKVFLFFLIQLFLRLFISIALHYVKNKYTLIIITDSVISISLYTYCFWNIIV